jgi:ABC-2 type transport system permease protein
MRGCRNTWTLAKRELVGYFASPVAYVFIIIFLVLSGAFTFMLGQFFQQGEANLLPFFMWHPWLYMFLVPAVGMRLWAEERRSGTFELLFTMPISPTQAIMGKFLAGWLFLGIALLLTAPMVWTVGFLGSPDWGVILCGYLGSFLVAGTFLAIASMTSAMTRNQVISFITSVVVCLALILSGWPPVTNLILKWASVNWLVEAASGISVMTHYDNLQRGLIDFRNLLYFASVVAFALFGTGVILKSRRGA